MLAFFKSYLPLLDLILVGAGYAFSQYIVLRSGTFSVATAGMASIGAYAAAADIAMAIAATVPSEVPRKPMTVSSRSPFSR
jgi:acyl-coenzyme A thioesterase PaaI-like protein